MKKNLSILLSLLMLVSLLFGCSQPAATTESPAADTAATEAPAADVAMQYMTADELDAVLGTDGYLVLDVRKAADYEAGHIPGSVSADMDAAAQGDTAAGIATMTAAVEGVDDTLVLVCYSGRSYAQAATNALSEIGYDMSKVYTLQDGFNNWSEVKADKIETGAGTTDTAQAASVNTVDADGLRAAMEDGSTLIIDLRDDDAYFGYAVDGISRGGHIPGAIQFSYSWLSFLDSAETTLQAMLEERGITADKNIILYSSDNAQSSDFAAQLNGLGYANVSVFNDLAAWADDASQELVSAPNKQIIVSVDWLYELINGGTPETYDNDKYVILDCAWGEEPTDSYKSGHIPGAYHFNTDLMEEDVYWNIRPIEELAENFRQFGIDTDTTVIVASNNSANVRVAYSLFLAGVKDVRVLNGDKDTWVAAGYELSTEVETPTPVDSFGSTEFQNTQYYLAMPAEVLAAQEDPNFRLVSIRSWEEFIGETSGYSYIPVAGEPAGAVWGHDTDAYYDIDGSLRNYDELVGMWAEWDISPDNFKAFYCGTGWRATVPFWICYAVGDENAALFDGGWHVWVLQMDSENLPIQVGDPR